MDFLLLQLADSAFPASGFVHSAGLEAAFQFGQAKTGGAVRLFLEGLLEHASKSALPFVAAAATAPDTLEALDRDADLRIVSPAQNRASRAQGRTFAGAARASFPEVEAFLARTPTHYLHHAPVFGAVVATLGVSAPEAGGLFLHGALRGALGAAVRLGLIGPHEAQELQRGLAPLATRLSAAGIARAVADAASASPLHDLYPMLHTRLYSRLFQS